MDILVDEKTLSNRVRALAGQINSDYAEREIDVVCLMNGAAVFCADLVREITRPVKLHNLAFLSYPNSPASGEVRITLDVSEPLIDRHVLVVEGVVVSGRTPKYIMDLLELRRPASLAMCALGIKPKARAVALDVKYSGFEFDAGIAVGYGMGAASEKALRYIARTGAHG